MVGPFLPTCCRGITDIFNIFKVLYFNIRTFEYVYFIYVHILFFFFEVYDLLEYSFLVFEKRESILIFQRLKSNSFIFPSPLIPHVS